jgi:hypothetical protein
MATQISHIRAQTASRERATVHDPIDGLEVETLKGILEHYPGPPRYTRLVLDPKHEEITTWRVSAQTEDDGYSLYFIKSNFIDGWEVRDRPMRSVKLNFTSEGKLKSTISKTVQFGRGGGLCEVPWEQINPLLAKMSEEASNPDLSLVSVGNRSK